jgi:hypothetical protein
MKAIRRAALTIIHVMTPVVPLIGYGYVSPRLEKDLARQVRAGAQKGMDRLVMKAKTAGAARDRPRAGGCAGRSDRPGCPGPARRPDRDGHSRTWNNG